jgi:2,3-dihydroxybiphenyl 1,2-dioxygenase
MSGRAGFVPVLFLAERRGDMHIRSLGYLGVYSQDLGAWREFASDVLAMQAKAMDGGLALRVDAKVHRVLVHAGHGVPYLGWEVADASALAGAASSLRAHGVQVQSASRDDLAARRVAELLWFTDPLGYRFELFHGLADAIQPFQPPRPLNGFRTGVLGMGHVVLSAANIDAVVPFYRDVLGMRVSDYTNDPFRAVFFHVNARHHSLALLQAGQPGLHHVMVEVLSVDDLGRAYDAALEREVVSVTLGRHTNDHMLSFYARSPSGFLVECGWGGRSVDDATWTVAEMVHGPSLWGHERAWLAEEGRAQAKSLRARAAADGVHAPVHVVPGEYDELPPE